MGLLVYPYRYRRPLFLLVTLTLWYAIGTVSATVIRGEMTYQPLIPVSLSQISGSLNAATYAKKLIVAAATPSFILVLFGLGIALVVGAFALLPSIVAEILGQYSDKPAVIRKYQIWLDNGLFALYWATECLSVVMVLFAWWNISLLALKGMTLLPIPFLAHLGHESLKGIAPLNQLNNIEKILTVLSIVIVSSATSLLALGSRLAKFTSGIRDLLDVVLDVDSYLRMHPRGQNPKSRIFNRYLSLLRYISNWSNPTQPGQKYSAVIIMAHSQGTAISADLLRFLKPYFRLQSSDSSLDRLSNQYASPDRLPIYLYTMGSPLKQLYNFALSFSLWLAG